jgi:Ribonuclease G/E
MTTRRLFLDTAPGERRGVVTLDGRPERLILERDGDPAVQALGARVIGRVTSIERQMGSAFVALGEGPDGLMELKPDMPRLTQGQAVEVEVRAEARGRKGPTLRFLEAGEGAPRLAEAGPSLEDQLRAIDRQVAIETGAAARDAADLAEAEALETVFALPGGGDVAIEATRALVSVDVDLGSRPGAEAKRAARQANLAALGVTARVLRLKGLGGLVVIDLVGRGHDGASLSAAARAAFQPDNPGVAIGPIGRFGTLELTVPRRRRPVLERLTGAEGGLTAEATALRLLRAVEREAAAQPGARLTVAASPEAGAAARARLGYLTERYGARFEVRDDPALAHGSFKVSAT